MVRTTLSIRLAAVAALLVAVPGLAQQAATTAAPGSTAVAAPAASTATAAAQDSVAVSSATAAEAKKITCRTERVTGSNFRTRKVCSSPNSEKASGDWVRDQQDRGAIGASAIVNAAGGG
ncbi:MAG: hypothetical protein FJ167_08980 [Gammaproteobacteria bacterium]|nr:hypothetical protein [Gammaproteobacteria bacterium]MBM4209640.1 hypothetical protein [Gammaproteobacteria bacterium]MBM4224909.1 hypothetical protein [Gammaproteobacteria bacterium]MBM4232432.1 hypothetical protein [Gammaproteobacteria bacterium]